MNPTARAYLAGRGITFEPLLAKLEERVEAEDGYLVVPWIAPDGTTRYTSRRALNGQVPKYQNQPGERPPLWATPEAWTSDTVGLAEGCFDALALCQLGLPAFACFSAELSAAAAEILATKQEVVFFPDADETGERLREKVILALAGRTRLRVARMPGGVKDASECLETLGEEALAACWVEAKAASEPWRTSWAPNDEDGTEEPPARLARADGQLLLYAGKRHWLQGEPESGKSWFAVLASFEALEEGETALYVDFEDSGGGVRSRLRALGANDLSRFVYVRPTEPLDSDAASDIERLMALSPAVVTLDGVSEAMALHGWDPIRALDTATFLHEVVDRFRGPSTATLAIDHVARGDAGKGRFAYGSQHKLAGVDVAYRFETVQPFSREQGGAAAIRVTKDRPGFVRSFAHNKELVGSLVVRPAEDGVDVRIDLPLAAVKDEHDELSWTQRRVLAALGDEPGDTYHGLGDKLASDGQGKPLRRETIRDAVTALTEAGLADGTRTEGREPSRFWRVEP